MYDVGMVEVSSDDVWETWETVNQKTAALGHAITQASIRSGEPITRMAMIPRGGLHIANILSRLLGLSGDQVLSLGMSRYDRDDPTHASEFKIGQLPSRELVEGQVVLLADEVWDSGETGERALAILMGLGAARVITAAIHYKPGRNTTGRQPDFHIEETNGWVHYPWEALDDIGDSYQAAFAPRSTST